MTHCSSLASGASASCGCRSRAAPWTSLGGDPPLLSGPLHCTLRNHNNNSNHHSECKRGWQVGLFRWKIAATSRWFASCCFYMRTQTQWLRNHLEEVCVLCWCVFLIFSFILLLLEKGSFNSILLKIIENDMISSQPCLYHLCPVLSWYSATCSLGLCSS